VFAGCYNWHNSTNTGYAGNRTMADTNWREVDIYALRPYFRHGRPCIAALDENGRCKDVPLDSQDNVFFTTDDWLAMDAAVQKEAKSNINVLKIFNEHRQHPRYNDDLFLDLKSRYKLSDTMYHDGDETYPLPVIHKECHFSEREILAAHGSKIPIDTSYVTMAAKAVVERTERLVLGVDEPFVWSSVDGDDIPLYGMCNHPNRITQTITNPRLNDERNPAWSTDLFFDEIGRAEATMRKKGFTGRLNAFVSSDWEIGVRSMLTCLDVTATPHLPLGTIVLCEMTPATMQIYYGLDFSVLQWSVDKTDDVARVNMEVTCGVIPAVRCSVNKTDDARTITMKVLCCIVPVIHKNHCGIMHLTATP